MTPAIRALVPAAVVVLALLPACGGNEGSTAPAQPSAAPAPTPGGSSARGGSASCEDAGTGPEPDAAGLRAFVRKRSGQLRDCYQRSLKRDSSVGGKATIRFTIGSCGELSRVEVSARRGKVDEAADCAARAMRGWRTPFRPAEPVTVEYPVAFSASM